MESNTEFTRISCFFLYLAYFKYLKQESFFTLTLVFTIFYEIASYALIADNSF